MRDTWHTEREREKTGWRERGGCGGGGVLGESEEKE